MGSRINFYTTIICFLNSIFLKRSIYMLNKIIYLSGAGVALANRDPVTALIIVACYVV